MFTQDSAFSDLGVSVEIGALSTGHPIDALPTEYESGCGAAQQGETMSPSQICASGPGNPAPLYDLYLDACARSGAPIVWPKNLDEDSGRVNAEWSHEMLRLKIKFFSALGSPLTWRTVTFSRN